MSDTYDAVIRSVLNSTQRNKGDDEPLDWTDRIMRQWQPIRPNPQGGGDFFDAEQEGMASHDLLQGADPREVIDPTAPPVPVDLGKLILRSFK